MLAARLPSLLPPMTDDEALSSAAILSASMLGFSPAQWRQRPFRAPHRSSKFGRAGGRAQSAATRGDHAGASRRAGPR
jgi:magnesium chelatase family protein